MLKKALVVSTALVGLSMVSAPASAGLIFSTVTTAVAPSGLTPDVSFTTGYTGPVEVTVTDCCITGDYYETWLNGVSIGTTPFVPVGGPDYSTGTFAGSVAAGTNFVQLQDQILTQLPAGVSVSISGVPEPSTWAMMGLGFAALGFAGYRRARKPVALTA